MSQYLRILGRMTDTPLFMDSSKLSLITENVLLKLAEGKKPDDMSPSMSDATIVQNSDLPPKVGIIKVMDSLVARNGMAASGLTSYESINKQMSALKQAGVTSIGFHIDSPGGESIGLFTLSNAIRGLKAQGINTFSYIDGMATSAAYAIAAATDTIYSAELGMAGSIAAIMVHLETSKMDEEQGKTYTIFRSKEEKALGDPHSKLSEKATLHFQTMLDNADTIFNNDVVTSRASLSVKDIVNMKGRSYGIAEAVKMNLVDKIVVNFEAAVDDHLSNINLIGTKMPELNTDTPTVETVATKAVVAPVVNTAEIAEKAMLAERERGLAIHTQCSTLGLPVSFAEEHIIAGYAADASLSMLTYLAEKKDADTAIDTSIGTGDAPNPDAEEVVDNTALLSAAHAMATGRKTKETT